MKRLTENGEQLHGFEVHTRKITAQTVTSIESCIISPTGECHYQNEHANKDHPVLFTLETMVIIVRTSDQLKPYHWADFYKIKNEFFQHNSYIFVEVHGAMDVMSVAKQQVVDSKLKLIHDLAEGCELEQIAIKEKHISLT